MKKSEGLAIGHKFKTALLTERHPVARVVLFGSVARDEAAEDSDLDIAVIGKTFGGTRQEENIQLRLLCWNINLRIEPISLHPEDFENPGLRFGAGGGAGRGGNSVEKAAIEHVLLPWC